MPRGSPGLNSGIYHVKPDLHWNRPGFQSWKPFAKTGYPKAWLDFLMLSAIKIHQKGVYSSSLNKLTDNITEGVSTWICSSRVFLSSAIRARISLRRTSKAHEAGDFMSGNWRLQLHSTFCSCYHKASCALDKKYMVTKLLNLLFPEIWLFWRTDLMLL